MCGAKQNNGAKTGKRVYLDIFLTHRGCEMGNEVERRGSQISKWINSGQIR